MEELKVLVADSSPVYRKMFTRAVTEVNNSSKVTCVASGDEARNKILNHEYDIIVIDAEIPGLCLLELLKGTMLETSMAFMLVTISPSLAKDKELMETLSEGAVACMDKPIYESYDKNLKKIKNKIVEILDVLRDSRNEDSRQTGASEAEINEDSAKDFNFEIILIASSTGGPNALKRLISGLRGDLPVPILIVQHIPEYFTELLASDINNISKLSVKVAEDGEKLKAGVVYLAPGGTHTKIGRKNRIVLEDSPPINGVRPSADALFKSVANDFHGDRVLTVVLTGMGRDSQEGVAQLKEKKECYCLTQSEKTSVVYGMPRAIVESGLADKIVDLDEMTAEVERLFRT